MAKDEKRGDLDDRGVIFLVGEISSLSVQNAIEKIIRMNIEGNHEFIQLLLSSPGGSVDAGFALIDMMQWSRLPVYTTGFGRIASMGLSVLMAGEKGHRIITPRATLMSHRFWTGSTDNYSGLVAKRKMEDLTHQRIVEHYLECSNLESAEEIENQVLRDIDTWLTPQEALKFGFIDAVDNTSRRPVARAA